MSHTFGRCLGGETRHLPPQVGRPIHYPAGPFTSELTATVWARSRGWVPEKLFLALLTQPPTPDGYGHEELVAEGYSRAEVHLVDLNGRHRANVNSILLTVSAGSVPVSHIALLDEGGQLHFYGRLLSTRASNTPASTFEFRAYSLSVIRLRPQDAQPARQMRSG